MAIDNKSDTGRTYRTECTGLALETVKAHQEPADITFFAACFCPFVQRVWIAFELLSIPYKVIINIIRFRSQLDEVDPYKKPKDLLEVSPKGLVPGLRINLNDRPRPLNESVVILEYLEELAGVTTKKSILPPPSDPYARALVRLQSDHINRTLVPAFYGYLQAQDPNLEIEKGRVFSAALEGLTALFERAENEQVHKAALGLWVEDGEIGWADVMVAPWLVRADIVLRHYKGYEFPPGKRFAAYLERLKEHSVVKRTTSTEDLYLDSYERYAFNRPNTSQVANAINEGRGLP